MASSSTRKRAFGPAGLRRRSELMEAAVRLAARNGFSNTRVSDVVGRVGVGQGVFYWYFESKEALFYEVLTDSRRRLRRFQGALIEGESDPVRRVARGILASIEFIAHNRHVFAFLDHAARQATFRNNDRQREARRVHVVDTARHIEEAIAEGLARPTDPEFLAQAVTGVVDRMARTHLGGGTPDEIDRVAQETIDFCVGGLMGPRTILVSELRQSMAMTADLLDIRDRVGALAPDGDGSAGGNGRVDGAAPDGRVDGAAPDGRVDGAAPDGRVTTRGNGRARTTRGNGS